MKTIIVACGSGIATSTILCTKIEELLNEHNISHELIQCSILEIEGYESLGDVIVSSTQLQKKYSIPTVMGISFITSIGEEATKEELLKILSKG